MDRRIDNMAYASLPVRAVNLILLDMIRLPKGQSCVDAGAIPICVTVEWSLVVDRLKVMCSFDPVAFTEPREGMFEIVVGEQCFAVRVEFPAGPDPLSVTVKWARMSTEQK